MDHRVLVGCCFAALVGVANGQPTRKAKSPAPVMARVLRVEIYDVVVVTFNRGASHGIDREWIGEFVDANDVPAAGGACMVIRLDKQLGICKTKLTISEVKRLRLRLHAP